MENIGPGWKCLNYLLFFYFFFFAFLYLCTTSDQDWSEFTLSCFSVTSQARLFIYLVLPSRSREILRTCRDVKRNYGCNPNDSTPGASRVHCQNVQTFGRYAMNRSNKSDRNSSARRTLRAVSPEFNWKRNFVSICSSQTAESLHILTVSLICNGGRILLIMYPLISYAILFCWAGKQRRKKEGRRTDMA